MSGLGACCVDPGAKQSHEIQGKVEKIGGVNTYKTGEGKSAIVVFTDIFGYSFVNVQKIGDTFANEDPINPATPNIMEILPDWLKKHPPSDACDIADKFISTIKGHYQSIQVN
jgi:dienelactone hydrolase